MIESSFEKLLVLLVRNKIDFVTVGGVAVCLNGYIRLTEDVDILVDSNSTNIRRMLNILEEFGEGFASELTVADFPEEEGAVRVIEASEDCQIDIFVRMRGNTLADLSADVRYFTASDGTRIPFLGSRGLIKLKSGSVREKDKVDVSVLRGFLELSE